MAQTKIVGIVDFSGVDEEAKKYFFERGHITAPNNLGVEHTLKDMIGQPVGLKEENGKTYLLARLYDGPDKSILKAHTLAKEILNLKSRRKFAFKVSTGRLEPYPQDREEEKPIWNKRMVVFLTLSTDPEMVIKPAPKKLDGFTMFSQPAPLAEEISTG